MVTGSDIKKAVIKEIKKQFDYKIMASDVKDGFDKPSFFVYIPFFHTSLETATTSRKTYQIEIQLNNASTNELLEVQEKLYNIFDYTLSVKDRVFSINNTDSEIIEKNLYFNFEVEFMETRENNKDLNYKKIKEINIKYKEED